MIADRVTISGTPQLGEIVEIKSDRTYGISYVQKQAQMNKETFKITKSAKKSTLYRPINALILVCHKDECKEANVELFSLENTKTDGKELHVDDEFLGEQETFNDDTVPDTVPDDNLEDMIVDVRPQEVQDEFAQIDEPAQDDVEDTLLDEPIPSDAVPEVTLPDAMDPQSSSNDDTALNTHNDIILPEETIKKRTKTVIVNVPDTDDIDEIQDITTVPDQQTPPQPKPKGRPKGKRRRKRFFY